MVPAASVQGRLTGVAEAQDFTVTLYDSDGNRDGRFQEVVPDAESRFVFTGLHPGSYTVAALANDGREKKIDVELKGGRGINIDLAVPVEAGRKP